jgi:hypothetical protein
VWETAGSDLMDIDLQDRETRQRRRHEQRANLAARIPLCKQRRIAKLVYDTEVQLFAAALNGHERCSQNPFVPVEPEMANISAGIASGGQVVGRVYYWSDPPRRAYRRSGCLRVYCYGRPTRRLIPASTSPQVAVIAKHTHTIGALWLQKRQYRDAFFIYFIYFYWQITVWVVNKWSQLALELQKWANKIELY